MGLADLGVTCEGHDGLVVIRGVCVRFGVARGHRGGLTATREGRNDLHVPIGMRPADVVACASPLCLAEVPSVAADGTVNFARFA